MSATQSDTSGLAAGPALDASFFAAPFRHPVGSPIRELFPYLSRPGMISFAGGMPDPALFDGDGLQRAQEKAWKNKSACLQYGPTDGLPMLRAALASVMRARGVQCDESGIMVTSGSQQGLDLLLRVMVEPGDVILVEEPAYPATLQAIRLAQARVVSLAVDDDGLDIDALSARLAQWDRTLPEPKALYTVPTFSNPTGLTMSRARRIALLELAVKHRLLLIEDDPYSELRFSGDAVPSLLALSEEVPGSRDWIVHFSSLSKIVAPGMRIGWMLAPTEIMRRCSIARQTVDLCGPGWPQAVATAYLEDDACAAHLPRIIAAYRAKCDALASGLQAALGEQLTFSTPQGGMFLWGRVASGVDAAEVLKAAIEQGVMFVPGSAFYSDKADRSTVRLSFAMPSVEQIGEGVKRLALAVSQMA
ncbi:PLP-dependent aminotransferase family protein [Robbsia sp. KACC 23696]|uniref:aminotransferase-like domain-containing protein n=1 Tax=Robbsia sp. KACC 23696 TaxID=3149231 RepID=UPI00325B93B7